MYYAMLFSVKRTLSGVVVSEKDYRLENQVAYQLLALASVSVLAVSWSSPLMGFQSITIWPPARYFIRCPYKGFKETNK